MLFDCYLLPYIMEGLTDAFNARSTALLPTTLYDDAGPLPALPDIDAILADAASGTKTRHGWEYDSSPYAPWRAGPYAIPY